MLENTAMKTLGHSNTQGIYRSRGFSLIEMAVVMVVLGLALGGLLVPMSKQLESSDRKQAQAQLQTIKEALIGHAMAEGRLPCPDTNGDGQENTQTVSGQEVCVRSYGRLPYHALAVGKEDPWNQPYAYFVTAEFADDDETTPSCATAPPGVSFTLCAAGNLEVLDNNGDAIAQQLPAIVLSHGKTRLENAATNTARSIVEARNFNPDQHSDGTADSKRKQLFSERDGFEFDDIVEWVPHSVLKAKMVSAGRLP
ncbi:MAG: prepilin-type N-terminal cleavage/methylation domain-containing protein [Pseudomonadales bacterium]